jgi:ketosteroid isomerase-like protein
MSQENVDVVQRSIQAWNRGDLVEWLAVFAPDAEWHATGGFPDQAVYRGRAGLERYWAEIWGGLDELSLSVSEVRAIGDKVLFAVLARGLGKRSKAPWEQPRWFVATMRDGLTVRVETYVDPKEALEAAGLRE